MVAHNYSASPYPNSSPWEQGSFIVVKEKVVKEKVVKEKIVKEKIVDPKTLEGSSPTTPTAHSSRRSPSSFDP